MNKNIETNDFDDNISEISDISDINDIRNLIINKYNSDNNEIQNILIKKYKCDSDSESNSNSESDSDSESDSESINSVKTYDTFNTSDSEILKKEEMKLKLLNSYCCQNDINIVINKSKDEFNLIFTHMLHELKKDNEKNLIKLNIQNIYKYDSDDDYLHDHKFF